MNLERILTIVVDLFVLIWLLPCGSCLCLDAKSGDVEFEVRGADGEVMRIEIELMSVIEEGEFN